MYIYCSIELLFLNYNHCDYVVNYDYIVNYSYVLNYNYAHFP